VDRRKKIFFFVRINARNIGGKADVLILTEGSSPKHDKASVQDTTGVEEQGMSSRG